VIPWFRWGMEACDGVATVSGGLRLTFAMAHERTSLTTSVRQLCVPIAGVGGSQARWRRGSSSDEPTRRRAEDRRPERASPACQVSPASRSISTRRNAPARDQRCGEAERPGVRARPPRREGTITARDSCDLGEARPGDTVGARTRFMHDGASLAVSAAITRHAGQAATAAANFASLSAANQANVLAFIFSLWSAARGLAGGHGRLVTAPGGRAVTSRRRWWSGWSRLRRSAARGWRRTPRSRCWSRPS
jgi:Di-haem oxidoreductase, putative peroxidase